MSTLADRLNQLGVKKASEITTQPKKNNESLQDTLGAEKITNLLGAHLLLNNYFDYGYLHGNIQFTNKIKTDEINKTTKSNPAGIDLHKIAFLDTETTGLAGGTGTMAFLVGLGRFTASGFELKQYLIEDPSEEASLLLAISTYLDDIEGLVTFNGKSFDIPLLKSRFVLNKLPYTFDACGHMDLLHISRRIWKNRLCSRTLKDLEQEILNLPRSEDEVPGWMIPEIYFNYLRSGDGALLKNVAYHNQMDIVSLAALYISIANMLESELFEDKLNIIDVFSIGQVYESIGEIDKAVNIFEYCLSKNSMPENSMNDLLLQLAGLYKKSSNWDKAVPLWKILSNTGIYAADIELAKYYEHVVKDLTSALAITEKAELSIDYCQYPRYKKAELKKEIINRKNRLLKRIG